MAFRGEDIQFGIAFDNSVDLDACDFLLMIYPDGKYDEDITIRKEELTRSESGRFIGKIPHTITKDMKLGLHTMEILLCVNGATRSIYMKRGALCIYDSSSKNKE